VEIREQIPRGEGGVQIPERHGGGRHRACSCFKQSNESCGPEPAPGCCIIAEGRKNWRAHASGCAPSAIESRSRGKYEAELLLENREQLRTVDRPRVAGRTTILDIFAIAQEAAHG